MNSNQKTLAQVLSRVMDLLENDDSAKLNSSNGYYKLQAKAYVVNQRGDTFRLKYRSFLLNKGSDMDWML